MSEPRRFSHSLVDCMLDCGRKAQYRYVDNVPSPKTAALVKGSACDRAWNYHLEQKMATGEDLPLADLLEITEQEFRDDVREQGGVSGVNWGESNARAELDSALLLTKQWRTHLAPDIRPTAVQVEYHRTLASGRDFIGFVDFEGEVDGHAGVIGDNKTAGRRMNQGDADKALQPYAYAWLREAATDFVFVRAIDTGKSQASEFVWTQRSLGDVDWYEGLVASVERQFERGDFIPNPKSFLCGPKHCPFYDRCMPHRVIK